MERKVDSVEIESQNHRTRPRRLTPGKIIGAVLVTLAAFRLLSGPAYECSHWRSQDPSSQAQSLEERAQKILSTTPLIDGHIDFAEVLRGFYHNRIDQDKFHHEFENGKLPGHVDLARLRHGLSGGAFWSVFAPCPANGSDFSDENYYGSVQYTMQEIDVMNKLFAAYPNDFAPKVNSAGALDAFKSGKLISPLGVEGLHQIGNSAGTLRLFHDLGARYATLTHNCHNIYADAALLENPFRKSTPLWGGVSPLGRQMVHEMNRIGMIVDLAHVSEDTMVHVLGGRDDWSGSRAPVIFSHSSAYSLCPHPRNVKDHVLQLVKKHNSVVMANIATSFIACADNGNANGVPDEVPGEATLGRFVEHIMHIGNLIGYDHVGVGTDFDGIPTTPLGMDDVSKYPDLVAELLRRGVSDEDAAKVVGGNVLRVWRDVDAVAVQMKAEGAPILEDDLKNP
ncbi:Dipeptidase sirJ [Cladobotryum mycophilum]|uniref:Dipeptidase n=1 Tax=Cladobotryum mycophilum TaxID=491253 RepID=A0ABR0SLY2_9HYPO